MEENRLLDRPLLKKPRTEVSAASIHYMFGSILQYCLTQAEQATQKQYDLGCRVGQRVLLLLSYRDKVLRREVKIVGILTFVSQQCWRVLFGRQGELFKCGDSEYMLTDHQFQMTRYCSEPRGDGFVNYAAFAAGIIEGILCDAEFPAKVTAHTVNADPKDRTVAFVIHFAPEALARENRT